jgi:hypothetical protein
MSYNDMGGLSLTGEYAKNKAFLESFKEVLDLRGVTYLMNNENNSTFVNHGSGNGSENLNDNFDYMMEIKDGYKTDTNDKNFPEALKQDARTQLAIIDDIEYKLGNALAARTNNSSMGGRSNKRRRKQTKRKRKQTKRKQTKRKQTKRKRKSNKRKY